MHISLHVLVIIPFLVFHQRGLEWSLRLGAGLKAASFAKLFLASARQPKLPWACYCGALRHKKTHHCDHSRTKLTRTLSQPMMMAHSIGHLAVKQDAIRLIWASAKAARGKEHQGVGMLTSQRHGPRVPTKSRLVCSCVQPYEVLDWTAMLEHARGLKTCTSVSVHSSTPL